MEIAIIVVTILLSLAVIAAFVVSGVLCAKERRKQAATANGSAEESGEQVDKKKGLKEWWSRHKPSKRRLIQVYSAILFNAHVKGYITGEIYKGNTKYACIPSLNCYSCPGAVGACPLGSLQNALRDANRSAPYYVLGIFAIFCLTLARTICGFLCPTGLLQEWLYKIRTPKLKKSKVTRVLSYFKYVLLIVLVIAIPIIFGLTIDKPVPAFCKYICPSGTFGGAIGLLINPNNDGTFQRLGPLFTWKFCVLVVIAVACVFIYRAFCRFLCPLGAIYGFFNRIALLGVKLDSGKCTDCGLCVQHCKMDIRKVGDHECINCGECISVCPAKAISWKGSKIFLRGSSIDDAVQEEVKPLDFTLKKPATAAVQESTAVETTTAVAQECAIAEDTTQGTVKVKTKRKYGRNFWLQVGAWAAALIVLLAALLYYNVFDKRESIPVGAEIGELCPDFTLKYSDSDDTYNLYENRGKITLINFWYIGCGGCEKEMPYIGELSNSEEYDVEIVVVHGLAARANQVPAYLVRHGWDKFDVKWVQDIEVDNDYQTYQMLGGKGEWPITVILDENGIVRKKVEKDFASFEELKSVIDEIKNN